VTTVAPGTMRSVLAVDGGNSKTDLAVIGEDGTLIASAHGPGTSHHHLGLVGAVEQLGVLFREASSRAGGATPAIGVLALAGADQPEEETTLEAAISAQDWAPRVIVRNDTFAVLRSGTDSPDGVAVVCGAGINCVGVADGHVVRFASLGGITGDWGGGSDVGMAALGAAVRSEDGRGPDTVLVDVVAHHFGRADATAVALDVHAQRISIWELGTVTPAVFAAAADGDAQAGLIMDRTADEVAAFVRAALTRLGRSDEEVPVVLGGSVLRAGWPMLDGRIDELVARFAPRAQVIRTAYPPLVGAALLALDEIGAPSAAHDRLRAAFTVNPSSVDA
jgi:N-acetylglucosamine kinase-like BadF-type ATPase